MSKCVNYQNTIMYKICCKDVNVKEIYVGSTTNFTQRKKQHKYYCNASSDSHYNTYVYQFIRDNGGFENWDIIMIEKYTCDDKLEQAKRERYWIETLHSTLNRAIPSRTRKEYVEDNIDNVRGYKKKYAEIHKEEIVERGQIWREENKDELKIKKKIYSLEHKEESAERCKIWREENKDYNVMKKKEYYEANKIQIAENNKIKITCCCGNIITLGAKSNHERTQKHINFIESKL